jgi:tetratricopeptide (TPR) repeat protein
LDKVSLHAVKVDETSAGAWSDRAQALIRLGRFDQALTANGKALDITDGRPDVSFLAQRSWILQSMDRLDEALEVAERASAIPPDISTGQEGFAIRMVCSIQLLRGQYKEAVSACDKSAAVDNWWVDHMWLAAAYAQLGDSARAAAETATLLKLKPDLTIEHLEKTHVGNAANLQRTKDQIFAGLRKAGVPER